MSSWTVLGGTLLWLAVLPVLAAPRPQAAYQIDLKAHQKRENEAISTLSLRLSDNTTARRLRIEYDILGHYRVGHVAARSNTQWSGQGAVDYRVSRSLSGLLDLNLNEVAAPGAVIEGVLDTQTQANGRAGLQWISAGSGRSQLVTLLQRRFFRYDQNQELDADEDRLQMDYRYHLDEQSTISLGFSRYDQRYRDDAQSTLDTDNSEWQLGFDKHWIRLSLDLFVSSRKVEFDDGSSDRFNGYGIELAHQSNTRNRLSLRLSRELQQAFRFNTQLGNALARLENAGLVETDRVRLGWDYRGRFTTLSLSLYQDDFDILNGNAAGSGRQKGGSLALQRRINERLRAELTATALDNTVSDTETRLSGLALVYQWLRTRRFQGELQLRGRSGKEAGQDADDLSLILQARANLLP